MKLARSSPASSFAYLSSAALAATAFWVIAHRIAMIGETAFPQDNRGSLILVPSFAAVTAALLFMIRAIRVLIGAPRQMSSQSPPAMLFGVFAILLSIAGLAVSVVVWPDLVRLYFASLRFAWPVHLFVAAFCLIGAGADVRKEPTVSQSVSSGSHPDTEANQREREPNP